MADSTVPIGRIFISYRREETAYPAGWLFDRLADRYGEGQLFKDVDSIRLGDDFVDAVTRAVGSCDVLLALIGEEWLTITDEQGRRRLDDPGDWVRVEIEAALTRNVRVVPILVDGVRMPRATEVPASLAGLVRRQALELSPARFESDLSRLLEVLDMTLAEVRTEQKNANDVAAPNQHTPRGPHSGRPGPSGAPDRREEAKASPPPVPMPRPSELRRQLRRLSTRPLVLAAVGAGIVMLAIAAMLVFPRVTSSPRSVEGSWNSIDTDGSRQTLTITTSGNAYAAHYHDDSTRVCDGAPLDLPGSGNISASTLTVSYVYTCPGGQLASATIVYHYSPDNDTLTDQDGVTWKRD